MIYVVVFLSAICLLLIFALWFARKAQPKNYVGDIVITEKPDGSGHLVSLELYEDPDLSVFKDEATFRVITPK